ncbi:MAG TPA: flavodoxin family protein [Clostridia bacterium]|nr:flavodoxin family protein [Clostridia bacterium]
MDEALFILGVSGSPRHGATEYCVKEALLAAQEQGKAMGVRVETKMISLAQKKVSFCLHCDRCIREKALCHIKDDMQEFYPLIIEAQGFVVASPVYNMNVSAQLQAFFNRWRPIYHLNPSHVRGKVGGAIAIGGTRNGGQEMAVSAIVHHYLTRGMIVVGPEPGYYSGGMVWSQDKKEDGCRNDMRGMESVRQVGRRVVEVSAKMRGLTGNERG